MLILSRRPGESIVIDGRIIVKIMRVDGDVIKLGIDAPKEVPVHRQEVYDEIQRNNLEALTEAGAQLPHLKAQSASSSPAGAEPLPARDFTLPLPAGKSSA